jgi:hypothetical protein
MTPAQMKTRIAEVMHRNDLTGQMANFMADAMERINRKFGVALVLPADNEPLPAPDLLFLYAGLQAGYEFTNNGENAVFASDRFEQECRGQFLTGNGSATDQFAGVPPVITAGA